MGWWWWVVHYSDRQSKGVKKESAHIITPDISSQNSKDGLLNNKGKAAQTENDNNEEIKLTAKEKIMIRKAHGQQCLKSRMKLGLNGDRFI